MSKRLSQKIKNSCAAMLAVMALAFTMSFVVAPFFPLHALYIQAVAVAILVFTAGRLAYKIVLAV